MDCACRPNRRRLPGGANMEVLRDSPTDAGIFEVGEHISPALPPRQGLRPRMRQSIPHLQLNQQPPAYIVQQLPERCLVLEHVRQKESRMATKGSCALWLPS